MQLEERRRDEHDDREGHPRVRRPRAEPLRRGSSPRHPDHEQQERQERRRLDQRSAREDPDRPERAIANDAPRRDRDRQRHEEVVMAARRGVEQHDGVRAERHDGEGRARRAESTRHGADHERRRHARSDRDQPERVHERVQPVGDPGDQAREEREQRAVDRRRVHPLGADQLARQVAREVRRGLHVRIRMMDGHDLPVGDVRVDVTRDEERQEHDREMEGDGQPERESHRDLAAPRGPQQHQEPDRPRGHAQHGRDRQSRSKSIQPDGLRDPDERAARLGARREDGLQRGSGDRGDDGLDQEAGHGRRDGRPGHPSPRCLHVAADASTGPPLGCTTWRDSARAPAPAWSSRSARSAIFSLFAWVLVFLLWLALSIYAVRGVDRRWSPERARRAPDRGPAWWVASLPSQASGSDSSGRA